MNSHTIATQIGIVTQLMGVGYLVYAAYGTSQKLAKYKANITYDNFSSAIADLAHEVSSQYSQQLKGFLAVAFGSLLQLYGAFA